MKKSTVFLTVILFFAIFSFTLGSPDAQTATANPMIYRSFNALPVITVHSPENNTTVTPDGVILTFELSKPTEDLDGYPYSNLWYDPIPASNDGPDFGNKVANATYYIDEQPSNVTIEVNSHLQEPFNCSVPLEGLTEGNHTLQIYLECKGVEGMTWMAGGALNWMEYNCTSQTVDFAVASPEAAMAEPDMLWVWAVAAVCVLAVGLLLFARHQKTKTPSYWS
ncbi:MAG: hypothetical protein ACQCN6_02835 [Candidatus Bathyarchaeia archaeon]|jgi:hypothetical protein